MALWYIEELDAWFNHINKCGGISLRKGAYHAITSRPFEVVTGYKFTFVREPIERFISGYTYYRYGTDYHAAKLPELTVDKAIDALERTLDKDPLELEHGLETHVAPLTHPIYHIGEMDFIGRTNHYQEDYEKLCDILGKPARRLPIKNKSHQKESLTDEQLERLHIILADDIKLWEQINGQ